MTVGLHFCTIGVIFNVLGGPLGPPWGTKRNPWGHPGAPSQEDTKNNQKDHFLVTCFEAQICWFFRFFWALLLHVFQRWQVTAKWLQNVSKRCALSTHFKQQIQNWETAFRLRRRERIEGQPIQKTHKNKEKTVREQTLCSPRGFFQKKHGKLSKVASHLTTFYKDFPRHF